MLFKKYKKVYIINEVSKNKFQLCKVLNEYDSQKAANNDLIGLLTKRETETTILKKYTNTEI